MALIRIALIEDHKLTRMGLRAALQQQDDMDCVGEAENGQDGLALLRTHQPDVAIVDIGLPDMDGIELVTRFRAAQAELGTAGQETAGQETAGQEQAGQEYREQDVTGGEQGGTRILMLTMHDSEKAVMAAFSAGADSYCMKQTELDDLMVAIRETHSGNAWIDPAIANIVLRQARQVSQEPSLTSLPSQTDTSDAEVAEETVTIQAVAPEYAQILETYPLTDRELEILQLIVMGGSNADIAEKLFITVGTVKTHVRNILNKLSVSDRTQAAVRALRAGLVD